MGLLFKARTTDIKGKPKVYFCSEAIDRERYLAPICEEILELQNCCIWYPEEGTDRADTEYLDDLCDMQLFVIPVSSDLIFRSSGDVKREYDLAIERRIPVLPIMVEEDLCEEFNRIYGDLQYLDRSARDDTAISYREKLKTYLSSVLVGDELAAKVRAAFDAYIFLSYRKKDRKYAKELMRLIHKNEFCRDIAIWYDEFLTPGENFNTAIRAALQKSELFVLTVTPNLINEINYIVTTEYPMARNENKPIVPAELVETDKESLSQIFAELPPCTDAHDDAELADALLEALSGIAVRENDGDAEHNFFIGLAYLSGIDVEIDYERALRLITSSAEAGLPEAIDQLMQMYRSGTGVQRDAEEALRWHERKLDVLRRAYEADPTAERFDTLAGELLTCGNYYEDTDQPKRCMAFYEEALSLSRRVEYPEAGFREAAALRSMGTYAHTVEQNGQRARLWLEEAVSASRRLCEAQDSERSKRSLADGLLTLGNLCRNTKDTLSARNYVEQGEQLYAALYEETGASGDQENLMWARDQLCLLYYKRKDLWPKAMELAEAQLTYHEKLAAEKKTAAAKYNLSVAYSRLGDVYEHAPYTPGTDYRPRRNEAYQRSYDVAKEVCEENPSASNKRGFYLSCWILAASERSAARRAEALQLAREIYESAPTPRAKADYAFALGWAARFDSADYLPNLLRAAELREELVRELGMDAAKCNLAKVYGKLADVYKRQTEDPNDWGRYLPYGQASEAYDKREEYCKKKIQVLEGTSGSLVEQGKAYENLGDAYFDGGRTPEAQAAYEESLTLRKRRYQLEESASACSDLLLFWGVCIRPDKNAVSRLPCTVERGLDYLRLCHHANNEYVARTNKGWMDDSDSASIAEAMEAELTQKLSEAEDTVEQARLYLSMARLHYYRAQYDIAERDCVKAGELVKDGRDDELLRIRIQALELRGDVYADSDPAGSDPDSPCACYTEAVRLINERPGIMTYDEEARILEKAGAKLYHCIRAIPLPDIHLDLSDLDDLLAEQDERQKLTRIVEKKRGVSFAYKPGHGEWQRGQDKACFEAALSRLAGREEITSLRLAGALHFELAEDNTGDASYRRHHLQEAVAAFRQIHDRMKESIKARLDLVKAYLRAGASLTYNPSAATVAREYFDDAIRLATELDKMAYTADVKDALVRVYFDVAELYRARFGDEQAAKIARRQGIVACEDLHAICGTLKTAEKLSNVYLEEARENEGEASQRYNDEALRVLREYYEKDQNYIPGAEAYFRLCCRLDCLVRELNEWIKRAEEKRTVEGYLCLVRQYRVIAEVSDSWRASQDAIRAQRAECYRRAYVIMTSLPKQKLGEKGLEELKIATHNAYLYKSYYPHLFDGEEPKS